MCGRYSMTQDARKVSRRFGVRKPPEALAARYNIAPSQDAPVVLDEGTGRQLRLFRWGLVPSWAKEASIGHKMINARAETVMDKPSYKIPFQRRRCLALADGFYEWRREDGLSAYEVSPAVNSPANDTPACLEPVPALF